MEQFGKYQLVRRIGSGGMAEIYLARTTVAQGLSKQLVIKKIHPAFARSRQFVSMFVDEAKIALGLNHPGIVQVFDFGQVGQTYFLAMEYVEGMDLLRVMQEGSRSSERVPLDLAAYIVQQVAKGLDYAHRKNDEFGEPLGIVHRDISPQNILLSWDGDVKIVDFGIARARHVQEEAGVVKGKFAYMAPEQARGHPVDRRADVFSAGVVLFELACGRPLFPGKGKEVLEMAKAGAVPRPRDLNPEIPLDLESTILKALTFDRELRFDTGRDLQNALGRFLFHWAQQRGQVPPDSGALAQYLAKTVQHGRSARASRPPTALADDPSGSDSPIPSTGANTESLKASSELATGSGSTLPGTHLREQKRVYLLRGSIRGLSSLARRIGAEAAAKVAADFFKVAQDIAFKHDAAVDRITDDELRIVVGVPVSSDGDGSRAIRLGLALIDALDGIGLDVEPELRLAIYIERAAAVVTRDRAGRYQHELEGEPGTAPGLALEAAGGEILVSSEVNRVTRNDWNFEEIAAPGGLRLHRLRGPKERLQRLRERSEDVELIGRDLELKALRDAYRDVLVNGLDRLIVITGEPGIGKRSLVNALLQEIPPGEANLMQGACRAATRFTPFGVVADLGRDAVGLAEGAAPNEIRKRIQMMAELLWPGRSQDEEIRELVDAAGVLFGLRPANARDIHPDELRAKLRQVAIRLEQRLTPDKPLIVIGENVHWADEQSLALTRDLISNPHTRGLLVIITSRPDPNVIKLAGEAGADIMRLGELDEEHQLALLARRFAPGEDVAELAKRILPRTGGNPYFIAEVLDSLLERGILATETIDGEPQPLLRWVQRDVPIEVPTTVEALLAARIDQLPREIKQTLLHASVLGSRCSLAALSALAEADVAVDLSALVERGLLRAVGKDFCFQNNMTMTVAYRMLAEDDRRVLHRRAAEQHRDSPGYRDGQDDAIIARHLELAGDSAQSASYYMLAAAHALQVGSNSDAYRQLSHALKLLPPADHASRFQAHVQREEALRRLVRRDAQHRELDAMRLEAEADGDPGRVARAHSARTQYFIETGQIVAAEKAVKPALEFAEISGNRLARAEALRLESSILRLNGKSELALDQCNRALALCGDSQDCLSVRAQILNNRGTILWNMDRLSEAIDAYAESLVIYRALHMPRQEARALNNMGIVFSALGEAEEALAHYKSSLKIDQRLGDRNGIALKLGNIGQTYADLGASQKGERYLAKALKLTQSQEDWATMIDIVSSLGQVHLDRNDVQKAREYFEHALELARQHQDRYQEVRAMVYLSFAKVKLDGDVREALSDAVEATALAHAMPMPVGEMYGLAAQALATAKLDQIDEALKLSVRAMAKLEHTEHGEGREQILSIHATLSERAGRLAEAREALERGYSEVMNKAARLSDRELREAYLAAPVPAAICRDYKRLTGRS